jgi:hypothetical protein
MYTEDGEEFVTDLFTGDASAPTNYYIHWGTDGTEAVKGDAALIAPGTEARVAATESQPTPSKAQFVGTLTCNSTPKTIAEVGLFNLITGGILIIRKNFAGIVLEENDTIEFIITLEQT